MKPEHKILLNVIIEALEGKKALDIKTLQVGELVNYTDYLVLCQAGETVPIGEVVARIETNGEPAKTDPARKPEKAEKPAPPKETPPPAAATGAVTPPEKAAAKPDKKEPPVIPAAEAKKTTPPALPVAGTPGAGEKVAPMTMLRRTAAKRLVEAKQQMAMLTTFNEVDTSAVQGLRKEFQEKFEKRHEVKLGFMSFFVKAVAGALKEFTPLNAEIRGTDIIYHQRIDIGVAIASDRGLVVPVLRHAEQMGFAEIEKAIADYAKRSREGKLKPQELEGGTFHNHQRRRVWLIAFDAHHQSAADGDSGDAFHSGTPDRGGRPGGGPSDDVHCADV